MLQEVVLFMSVGVEPLCKVSPDGSCDINEPTAAYCPGGVEPCAELDALWSAYNTASETRLASNAVLQHAATGPANLAVLQQLGSPGHVRMGRVGRACPGCNDCTQEWCTVPER